MCFVVCLLVRFVAWLLACLFVCLLACLFYVCDFDCYFRVVCFLFVVLACSGIRALPRQGHARRALRRGNFCLFLGVVLFCLFILACLLALFARVVCLFVCCFCFVDGLSVCFFLYV